MPSGRKSGHLLDVRVAPERGGLRIAVYFTAADGSRWRVYDRLLERGADERAHWRSVVPPSSRATARVFVPPDPAASRRLYQFGRGEVRSLTESRLEAQLHAAGFLGRERFRPEERGPR